MLDYFHSVSNFPFLEKVVENVVVQQLLWAMDKVEYLTLFSQYSDFGHWLEMALTTLLN